MNTLAAMLNIMAEQAEKESDFWKLWEVYDQQDEVWDSLRKEDGIQFHKKYRLKRNTQIDAPA